MNDRGREKTVLLSLQASQPVRCDLSQERNSNGLAERLAQVESLGGTLDSLLQIIREQLRLSAPSKTLQPQQRRIEPERTGATRRATSGPSTPPDIFDGPQVPQPEIDDLILKGMHDLDSAVDHGASVLLRDLRKHMPAVYRGHDTFDTAVLRLADQDRIVLHRDDHPAGLTEAERDELVRDENGTYYISIARRV